MKQRIFSTLLFSVLLLFALNLRGDISYTSNPVVGVDFSSFTKYVDVVTGAESWYRVGTNGTVRVYVSAGMEGVGQGQGTLTSISIPGIMENSIGTYQEDVDDAGTKDENGPGSYDPGMGTADTTYPVSLPDDAEDGDSWRWSTGGYTTIWPWEWHETTAWGVQVHVPKGVAGRYTTTGGWQKGTTIRRDAPSRSGTITLDIQYKCSNCSSYGDREAAVCGSGMGVTCPRESCGCKGAPTSYGCSKVASRNWCNDGGTCTVGSGPGVPGPQCGENWCCCAGYSTPPSGGSTPPSGSSTPPGGTSPSEPSPPTDNTPNCPDCTSDCSSPCSCMNSGTCGGTVSTPPEPPPPEPEPEPPTCSTERVWRGGTHKCDSAGSCSSTGPARRSSCGRGRCSCS